ncbi:MAG: hypothetical protein ACUVSY_16945, partial [Roseiflexus sp.]
MALLIHAVQRHTLRHPHCTLPSASHGAVRCATQPAPPARRLPLYSFLRQHGRPFALFFRAYPKNRIGRILGGRGHC